MTVHSVSVYNTSIKVVINSCTHEVSAYKPKTTVYKTKSQPHAQCMMTRAEFDKCGSAFTTQFSSYSYLLDTSVARNNELQNC